MISGVKEPPKKNERVSNVWRTTHLRTVSTEVIEKLKPGDGSLKWQEELERPVLEKCENRPTLVRTRGKTIRTENRFLFIIMFLIIFKNRTWNWVPYHMEPEPESF
jgi:hypothetical protein